MIFDSLKHIDHYKGLAPRIYKALEILRDTDFSKMEDGSYELEGFDFRYNLQSYTVDHGYERFEAHKDFLDIQYVISGREAMGVNQVEGLTEVEARPQNDIWFYDGPVDTITVEGDKFAIFFPNDAHAPGLMPESGPCAVRKCVFKIHI